MATSKKLPRTLTSAQQQNLSKLNTVSDQIRYLNKEGFTTGDISRSLSSHLQTYVRYQWVRNVLDNDKQKARYQK